MCGIVYHNSAFNVDFSSSSPNPLSSRRSAQAGVKDSYPSKKWLFYHYSVSFESLLAYKCSNVVNVDLTNF